MAYLSISNLKFTSTVSDEEFEGDALEERIESFREELSALLAANNFEFVVVETSFLNKEKYSVCKCSKCEATMINRDENPIGYDASFVEDVVLNGGNHEGKVLCEECLPKEHRWSALG